MKKHEYLIVRYGSNRANQNMCNRAAVAVVEATSRQEAKDFAEASGSDMVDAEKGLAGERALLASVERSGLEIGESHRKVSIYNGQFLEAIPMSRARESDLREVFEGDAMFGDDR